MATQTIDIDLILDELRVKHDCSFSIERFSDVGISGAWIVRQDSDKRLVLKYEPGKLSARVAATPSRTERLRAKGYVLPMQFPAIQLVNGFVMLQEFIDGSTSNVIDRSLLQTIVTMNALQIGVGDTEGTHWKDHILMTLAEGVPTYCNHQTVASYSDDSRALLQRIKAIGRDGQHLALSNADLVHHDFHHLNVLHSGSQMATIIDWDGLRPGDALFDLVTFTFWLEWDEAQVSEEDRAWMIDQLVAANRPDVVGLYAAHMSIRAVHLFLRLGQPEKVDRWIGRCNTWLDKWT